jgi:hypothetical protein
MHSRSSIRNIASTLIALLVCTAALAAQPRGRGPAWTLLGSRTVTDRLDHDTVVVTGAKGSFNAIKLQVTGHAVDFQKVVVHFKNGDDQNVELRNTIPAGGSSRDIDIQGANRIITKIDFWYDAHTLGKGGHAVVKTLGRH